MQFEEKSKKPPSLRSRGKVIGNYKMPEAAEAISAEESLKAEGCDATADQPELPMPATKKLI